MIATANPPCTGLKDGATLRLQSRIGAKLSVRRGQVWITQDEDARDLVLDAGDSFEIDRPGLAVVQAFGESCVSIGYAADNDHAPRRSAGIVVDRVAPARPSAFGLELQARAARARSIADLGSRLVSSSNLWVAMLMLSVRRHRTNAAGHGRVIQC